MGDTKMFLFFSNVLTINAFVIAEVNCCSDSIKHYFTDEFPTEACVKVS